MLSGLNGGCVVAILPESSFSLFSIVEFLTSSSRNKLNGIRNYVPPVCVLNEQVDMLCEAPNYVKFTCPILQFLIIPHI